MVQRSGYLVSQIAQDFECRVKLLQPAVSPNVVTQRILAWTAGQPFLTYRLYELILQGPLSPANRMDCSEVALCFDAEGGWVDEYIRDDLIKHCSDAELIKHLREICRDMIQDPRSLEMLKLYRWLRRGRSFKANLMDHVQRRVVQAGLAKVEGEELKLSNRFYREVFNRGWLVRASKAVEARLRDEAVAAINAVFTERQLSSEIQPIPRHLKPEFSEHALLEESDSSARLLLERPNHFPGQRSSAVPQQPARSALWMSLAVLACAIGAAATLLFVSLDRSAEQGRLRAPSMLQLRAVLGNTDR